MKIRTTNVYFQQNLLVWLKLKRNLLEMEMVSRFFNQEDYHVMHLEKAVLGCHHLSWMT